MPLCQALARTYPERPSLSGLERFERFMAHIFGEAPDPVM
jgi:hypothetical protein